MYMEEDGWRNEDTEGPYCPVLRTKGDWVIARYVSGFGYNSRIFYLKHRGSVIELEFDTIENAKAYANKEDLK